MAGVHRKLNPDDADLQSNDFTQVSALVLSLPLKAGSASVA